jgi:hypothetical protein
MKKSVFYSTLLVGTMVLPSCSSDEPGSGSVPVDENGCTYVAVTIRDAGSATRAADDYALGTEAERKVKTANFYFYDSFGNYVKDGKIFDGTSSMTGTAATDAGNVSWTGQNVLQIDGLDGKTWPKYVVTVINAPSDFAAGSTLKEMKEKVLTSLYNNTTDNNYVMTTSTYNGASTDYNFVTELSADNFIENPTDKTVSSFSSPAKIYVERVAAKATLSHSTTDWTGDAYKIGKQNVVVLEDGALKVVEKEIWVELKGWGLNVTEKSTYALKHLGDAYTENFDWNSATDFRSFWGESVNYATSLTLPTTNLSFANGDTFNYLQYSALNNSLATALYCTENTAAYTSGNTANRFTSAAISAVLHVGGATADAADYVRFGNTLYQKDAFLTFVANEVNADPVSVTYTVSWPDMGASGGTANANVSYNVKLTAADLQLVSLGNGKVKVAVKDDATLYPSNDDFANDANYIRNALGSSNNYTYTATNSIVLADVQSSVNAKLLANSGDGTSWYASGKMFYNVPFRHINSTKETGYYGVVRNHVYQMTVSKITDLGHAVNADADYVVPTTEDDPEKSTYGIVTQLDILSWRIVNNTDVELK